MATPFPTQSPIKSTARKLPIKRKSVLKSPDPIPTPNPTPNPNSPIPYNHNFDDEEESNSQDGGGEEEHDDLKPPPFKFHRIWSESDEIRFLQGLLGCASQGLLFPRDLNVFYDRFSESMPQPYTRLQLSEKLRRLRKKFRVVSGRIARGQDPNRLAPHDRDLLHLCSRLWDPKFASSSPFSDAGCAVAAVWGSGNKRRRPNPRLEVEATPTNVLTIDSERRVKFNLEMKRYGEAATPGNDLTIDSERRIEFNSEMKRYEEEEMNRYKEEVAVAAAVEEKPKPKPTAAVEEKLKPVVAVNCVGDSVGKRKDVGYVAAKAVLDVFDGLLKEIRECLMSEGSSCGSELAKRWQEQQVAELDVFARRLRLVLEQSHRS